MRIFITGGSGFVGGHVVEALSLARHEVLALARSERAALAVRTLGATPVTGDLATLDAIALKDVDVVVHAAARAESWGPWEAFRKANVEGTARVLAAARGAGVRRFIHIGTEAMLFDGHDLLDADETTPPPARQRFAYSATKAEAERLVLAASSPDFTTMSLRPRLVWGPRDASVLPEVLEAVEKGAFAWIDGGRQTTSTTYVGNLVHAVELALHRGEGGQAYFVADAERHRMKELLSALAATRGVTLPARSLPGALARPVATVAEGLWKVFAPQVKPPMSAFAIAMLSRSVTVRFDKARRELGYTPIRTFEEGLEATRADAARARSSVATATVEPSS